MTAQNAISTCPIWGNGYKAEGFYHPQNRMFDVRDSERAFYGYRVSEALVNSSVKNLSEQEKARLTTWIIDQSISGVEQPKVTLQVIHHINGKLPLRMAERADRLLRLMVIGARTNNVGVWLRVSRNIYDHYAWSESTNWEEVEYLLTYLCGKGWLDCYGDIPGIAYKVTVEGHGRVEEFERRERAVDSSQKHVALWTAESGTKAGSTDAYTHDFFICHASEDKDGLVRELADSLRSKGAKVWYDEFTLRVGSRLRRNIERGLATSRFGIVIVSPSFFVKDWPQNELDGLFALASQDSERILPIWHNVTRKEVADRSPMLADILALDASLKGIDEISLELMELL